MMLTNKQLISLIPRLINKIRHLQGPSYRIVAAGYSKKGSLIGIEMNGWRELIPNDKGKGKHAEASLIKKFGRKIDTIYILRCGRSLDILPIHPCKSCAAIANKMNIKIIPIHECLKSFN
jgi:hypothetical protein